MALRILKSSMDGATGHLQHLVRVEEEISPGQISFGPEETVGIWPAALLSAYHGPEQATDASIQAAHEKWLEREHGNMLLRKRHLDAMARVAHGLKGKLMFEKVVESA